MGLNTWINRMATSRAHVLVVGIPGHSLLRMQVEAAITTRGWVLAHAPADADALLVCGHAPEPYPGLIEGLWNQVPGPRCRVSVASAEAVDAALDSIPDLLGDRQAQAADSATRPKSPDDTATADQQARDNGHDGGHHHAEPENQAEGTGHPETGEPAATAHHQGHDHAGKDDRAHDDGRGGEADMGDMDMDDMDMDMSGPAGIPLAGGDDNDRDGLEMDITHLSLGPVLPHWPAGLVVRCTLHGDIIAEAAIETLPPGSVDAATLAGPSSSVSRAVELSDAAAHLLSIAGWEPVAAKVRRLRDELLGGQRPVELVARGLTRTTVQVARSRTLRWSLRGTPALGGVKAHARLLGWLRTAAALLAPGPAGVDDPGSRFTLDEVREALIGQELATARLVMACIEPSRATDMAGAGNG
ncbi:hypothetical protein [Arthrobacter sp.]|uniref:hypothetical protein n=1 Tax=Arthrobacter sp. TaxID=1667 RepID=UPI003A8D5035